MTDYTLYKFEEHEGMPPDGERAIFLGFTETGRACLLRWDERMEGNWMAITFGDPENMPRSFLPNTPGTPRIKSFAFLPSEFPLT